MAGYYRFTLLFKTMLLVLDFLNLYIFVIVI